MTSCHIHLILNSLQGRSLSKEADERFFQTFLVDYLVLTFLISRRKITVTTFSGGHILRGMIEKSWALSNLNNF